MNAWELEILIVRGDVHTAAERRSLARDVERGLRLRLRPGVYVDRAGHDALDERDRHVVAMRALAAVAPEPVLFSHWSAAVLHGLPFLGTHLDRVHVAVESDTALLRGQRGVAGHVLRVHPPFQTFGLLLATDAARTAVDIAAADSFEAGVVVADAVLASGVPRWALERAVDLDPGRRGGAKSSESTAFAHPGAESAAESLARISEFRLGIPPLRLQFPVRDLRGFVGALDQYSKEADAGVEIDGLKKYLDPRLAKDGAAAALIDEKRRQDRMLLEIQRMARFGWRESRSPALLAPILAKVRIVPDRRRATRAHYVEAAAAARPRLGARATAG